jgi:hypothetical protein
MEETDEQDARADGREGLFGVSADVCPPQEQWTENDAGPSRDDIGDGHIVWI